MRKLLVMSVVAALLAAVMAPALGSAFGKDVTNSKSADARWWQDDVFASVHGFEATYDTSLGAPGPNRRTEVRVILRYQDSSGVGPTICEVIGDIQPSDFVWSANRPKLHMVDTACGDIDVTWTRSSDFQLNTLTNLWWPEGATCASDPFAFHWVANGWNAQAEATATIGPIGGVTYSFAVEDMLPRSNIDKFNKQMTFCTDQSG